MRANDGRTPCHECGERVMFASPVPAQPVCGDCLERRTPLKREIEFLRGVLGEIHINSQNLLAGGLSHFSRREFAETVAHAAKHALEADEATMRLKLNLVGRSGLEGKRR